MVERGHEHLDAVLGHDADTLQQMLFRRSRHGGGRTGRRGGRELVDELVDARHPERPDRRAREQLPASRAHVEWDGAINTSEPSSCFRYTITFW